MKQPESDSDRQQIVFKKMRYAMAVLIALLIFSCEDNLEKIKAFSVGEELPAAEAVNFKTMATDSGEIVFLLKAPRLLQYDDEKQPYIEFPRGMEMIRYDKNGKVISSITANYARQYESEKRWEAKNRVVAVNAQGDTLKTELLNWDEKSGRIYTDEYVRIIRPDQIIAGEGFQSDQSMENWKIKNPRGTIYINVEDNP